MRTGNLNGTLFGDEWQAVQDYSIDTPWTFTDDFTNFSSWTALNGTWATGSGRAYSTSLANHYRAKVTGSSVLDGTIEANIGSAANYSGVIFRGVDLDNYYFVVMHNDTTAVRLIKVIAGDMFTNELASASFIPNSYIVSPYIGTLKVQWSTEGSGMRAKIYFNGLLLINYLETTATYPSAGFVGVQVGYGLNGYVTNGHFIDDFAYGTSATANYPVQKFGVQGLEGNEESEYRIITRFINGFSGACEYGIQINGDWGNNYGFQQLGAENVTVGAARNTSRDRIDIGYNDAVSQHSLSDTYLYSKSGFSRLCVSFYSRGVSGTSVTAIYHRGVVWNNTSSEINSLTIFSGAPGGNGLGTRIIVMRRSYVTLQTIGRTGDLNVYGRATGCWQLAYSQSIGSAVQTHSITGLDGDRDVLYMLRIRFISNSANPTWTLRLNNDSGANYGHQYLYGNINAISCNRQTGLNEWYIGTATTSPKVWCFTETLIYAKSGYVRTSLNEQIRDVTYDTCNQTLCLGNVWSNTASNLTSLDIIANQASGIGSGTWIELWAYRP